MKINHIGTLALGLVFSLFTLAPVLAQPDDAEFLQKLKQKRMDDILTHYLDTNLEAAPDSPMRVIWLTEKAKTKIDINMQFTSLPMAAEFVVYGLPSLEQLNVVNKEAAASLEMLNKAESAWFWISSTLPRDPNFESDWENTGRWHMMRTQYAQLFIPYYKGLASMYLANQDAAGPYFAKLKEKKGANFNYAAERKQMLASASSGIANILEVVENYPTVTRGRIYNTLAMVYYFNGETAKAMEQANAVLQLNNAQNPAHGSAGWDFQVIKATLARAMILAKQGQAENALKVLDNLLADSGHPTRTKITHPVYAILVAARKSAIMVDAEMENSGAPYDALAKDPRWAQYAQSIYEISAALINPKDTGGGGEGGSPIKTYTAANKLFGEATKLRQAKGDPEEIKAKALEAAELFQKAIDAGLKGSLKNNALYFKGYCYFYAGKALDSAKVFLAYCKEFPAKNIKDPNDRSMAAAAAALKFAQDTYDQMYANVPDEQKNPAAMEFMIQVANELNELDWVKQAGVINEYAIIVASAYKSKNELKDAVTWYRLALKDEDKSFLPDTYFGLMDTFYKMMTQAETDKAAKDHATQVVANGKFLIEATEPRIASAKADRKGTLVTYLALGKTYRAEALIAMEARNFIEQAIKELDGMEDNPLFEKDKGLVTQAINIRIQALQALGSFAEIEKQIDKLWGKFGDEAGALLEPILDDMEVKILAMERRNKRDQAKEMGKVLLNLTNRYYDWVRKRLPDAEEAAFVPVKVRVAKAMVSAQEYTKAIGELEALNKKYENQLDVMEALAESFYRTGDTPKARDMYEKVSELCKLDDLYGEEYAARPPLEALLEEKATAGRNFEKEDELKAASDKLAQIMHRQELYWKSWVKMLEISEENTIAEGQDKNVQIYNTIIRMERMDSKKNRIDALKKKVEANEITQAEQDELSLLERRYLGQQFRNGFYRKQLELLKVKHQP